MISNVPIGEIPETKRITYLEIKREILINLGLKKRVFTLFGPKRVGKTVLLKQLCSELDGCYFSMRAIKADYSKDWDAKRCLKEILRTLECGKSLICIDDIIMMPREISDKVLATLREAIDKTIVVSGNVKCFVDNCAEELGSLKTFTMSGLSFYEYCNWRSGEYRIIPYSFIKYKQDEELRSLDLYLHATLRDIKNCYDYPKFCEDANWITSYKLMDEWRFVQTLRMLNMSRRDFYESMKEWACIEKFLVQIGLLLVYDEYMYLPRKSTVVTLNKRHCYPNFEPLGLEPTQDSNFLFKVYCYNELLKHFEGIGDMHGVLGGDSTSDSDFPLYFVNSALMVSITGQDSEISESIKIAKKLGINKLIVTTSAQWCVNCETIDNVEVLKVTDSYLAYALGELETIPNVKDSLTFKPLGLFKELVTAKADVEKQDPYYQFTVKYEASKALGD